MDSPKVTIKQGSIIGTTGTNLDGQEIYKFLGIPYAKPPLGALRFKAPQPPEPWEGTRDCTKDGEPCLSSFFTPGQFVGSEDCLYLNVHTKELPKKGVEKKPVMVFIHGGGFTAGTGTQAMCDPQYMLIEDIVLVTINYRLGILGFLSLDDISLEVPGNAGLKDQTMALKWVQENISSFNGDPNNVTIFGVSAGGASVQFQVISPTAKGLFHKAIMQSGSVLNSWAWGQKNAIEVAKNFEENVSSEKEALDIIMNISGEELLRKFTDHLTDVSVRRQFSPVIEKPNPTAFLTEDPAAILISGRYNQVPTIQGVCSKEGLIYDLMKTLGSSCDFNPAKGMLPWSINQQDEAKVKFWSNRLQDLYYSNRSNKEGYYEHLGDIGFNVGIIESTKMLLKNALHPVYFYMFSYENNLTNQMNKVFKFDDEEKGVVHGMDGNFFFPATWMSIPKLTNEDSIDIKKVLKIWTDFARTGNPHPKWEPITDENEFKFFNINKEPEMLVNPFEERMNVWSKLLEDFGGLDLTINEIPT